MASKILKILFFLFLCIFLITAFTKNRYRDTAPVEQAFSQPVQTETENKSPVVFSDAGYRYTAYPLYDYEINAMVVHKMDYTKFSIHRTDSVFPMDLCLIWGDNLKNGYYQSKDLEFSQDFRFCLYNWRRDAKFNPDQVSNNHLLINNDALKKEIKKLSVGDQIKIKGRLVNVEAENLSESDIYNPPLLKWNSSLGRDDQGAGACEIILVDGLVMLQKSNPWSYALNIAGKYGFAATGLIGVIYFFAVPVSSYRSRGKNGPE